MPKTNATRLLDSLGIEYKLLEYEVDLDDLTAESTAQKLELAPEQVFKTLVVRSNSNQIYFAVIPGNYRLNFKALAKLAGERKVEMVSLKELKLLTGYIRGGVTAMASKKDYPVFVDETIEVFNRITVSAGVRGTLIMLTPQDYLQVVEGVVGDIALLD